MASIIGSAIVLFFTTYFTHRVECCNTETIQDSALAVFDFGMNFKVYKQPVICYESACNVCSLMRIT